MKMKHILKTKYVCTEWLQVDVDQITVQVMHNRYGAEIQVIIQEYDRFDDDYHMFYNNFHDIAEFENFMGNKVKTYIKEGYNLVKMLSEKVLTDLYVNTQENCQDVVNIDSEYLQQYMECDNV